MLRIWNSGEVFSVETRGKSSLWLKVRAVGNQERIDVAKTQTVTSIDVSPEDERRSRMVRYLVAMSIRVVCIIAGVYVEGWLMWVCFAGAIFLPYFAVIIANATGGSTGSKAQTVVAPKLQIEAKDFKIIDVEKP
jgi:hypothetical protein